MARDGFLVGPGHGPDGPGVATRGDRVSRARVGTLSAVVLGDVDEVRGGTVDDSPAATLLAAWQREGPAAVDRLVGPWSGVVRDGDRLHACREVTGSRPLYLSSTTGGQPVAGTDLEEVLAASGRPRRAAPLFLACSLNGTLPPAEVPALDGVAGTRPGAVATWTGSAWDQRTVADWRPVRVRVPDLPAAVALVAERLDEAVRARVAGRASVAVALSGGIDSANVLAAAVRVADPGTRVSALAIPFSAPQGDERAQQQRIAGRLGVPLQWVPVDGGGVLTGRGDRLLDGRGWPPVAGNWFFQDAVAEAADTAGIEVVLDGEDADSAFAGSRAHLGDLLLTGRWRALWAQAERYRQLGARRRGTLRHAVTSLLPPALDHRLTGRPKATRISPRVGAELARASGLQAHLDAAPANGVWAPGRRFRAAQRLAGLPDLVSVVALETSAGALRRDVDVLHPFQDRRVLELAMGLPWHVLTDGLEHKRVLRALAAERLGADVVAAARKAVLDEHWRAAALGRERALALRGLDAAAARPDVFGDVPALRRGLLDGADPWPALRVAVLALWLEGLDG